MKSKESIDILLLQTPLEQLIVPPLNLAQLKASIKKFNNKIEIKALDLFYKYNEKFWENLLVKRECIKKRKREIVTECTMTCLSSISTFRSFLRNYLLSLAKASRGNILDMYLKTQYFFENMIIGNRYWNVTCKC